MGDQTYIWYSAWHDGNFCLATWERDRFGYFSINHPDSELMGGNRPTVGIDPHFISCPVQPGKKEARVFVNAGGLSEYSYITLEVLDHRFNTIPEYSKDDCIPIKESGFKQPVAWRNKRSIEPSENPVRIRVNYKGIRREDSHVYAVYLEE